jgi:hypothetical protein
LPRPCRTTSGAKSTLSFATRLDAGSLLPEERCPGLHYWLQDCNSLPGCARAVHPTISKEEEQQYSSHSLQVWACVFLNEAGKSPNYIKKRLRWMGDSFWMYLRDTCVIQDQHCKALRASSEEVMDLVSTLPDNILRLSIMSDRIGDEDDMGVYHDNMD